MNKIVIVFFIFIFSISVFALELSKQPTVIDIPTQLKKLKKVGYSKLFINLDKTGKMGIYGFYKSSPIELEKYMKKYIKKFKFSPAKYKNKVIPIRIHLKYDFKTKKAEIYKVKENKAFRKAKVIVDQQSKKEISTTKLTKKIKKDTLISKEVKNSEVKKEIKANIKKPEVKKDMKTIISEAKEEIKKDLTKKDTSIISEKKKEVKKEVKKDTSTTFSDQKKKEETRHALSQQKKEIKTPTLSKFPKLKKFIEAEYPRDLRKNKIEGVVTLFIDINEKGLINNLGVIKSTNELFNKSAIEAVKMFEFEPAEYQNKPVPVRITYNYQFVIKDEKDATAEEVKKAKDKKTIIIEKEDYDSISGLILMVVEKESLL